MCEFWALDRKIKFFDRKAKVFGLRIEKVVFQLEELGFLIKILVMHRNSWFFDRNILGSSILFFPAKYLVFQKYVTNGLHSS